MKTRIVSIALLACLFTACATGPARVERSWWKPWTWRSDKTGDERKSADEKKKVEAAIDANSDALIQGAAGKVAATGEALRQATNREPAVELATTFNAQAGALLPKPTLKELADLKAIVGGLLSTNAAERASATARLETKDKELADLQRMTGELRAKLEAAEENHERTVAQLQSAYAGERSVADKWREHQAKTWLARIGDLLGAGGMVALAVFVPAMVPLAGRLFGFMSKVMPSSAALTGVVSKVGFDNVVAGVETAVAAVRQRDPKLAAEVLDKMRIERSPDDDRLIDARRTVVGKRASVQRAKIIAA